MTSSADVAGKEGIAEAFQGPAHKPTSVASFARAQPAAPARRYPAGPADMLDVGHGQLAERGGVLGAQFDARPRRARTSDLGSSPVSLIACRPQVHRP